MRKTIIPIISTFIVGLISNPVSQVSAAIVDKGTTWWDVPELLDYYTEVEAERIATCGDDFDCSMDFDTNHYENSEKYRALHNILEGQILVTSINPTTETLKVLFYDEDMMLRHMGIHENLELEHLYFGWFDEWTGQIYNYDHDKFTNGSMPDSHPLYDSTTEDLSIIIPWQEVEIPVAGGDLIYNPTGKIDYAAFAKDNKFNAQGHFDYSSCLNADDYVYGIECRLMSSGDRGYAYFPPRESVEVEDMPIIISSNEEPNNPDDAIDELSGQEPTDEPIETLTVSAEIENNGNGYGNTVGDDSNLEIADEPEGITNNQVEDEPDVTTQIPEIVSDSPTVDNEGLATPSTPETGTTISGESSATEFPWWMGTIIALNALTLIWLFLPIRTKAPKTTTKKPTRSKYDQRTVFKLTPKSYFSAKKCQKTLDKKYQLR